MIRDSETERAQAFAKRKNIIIAAFSNLSTAYNLVNINLAHVCMENQYCGGDNCKASVTTAGTACLVGAILGQLSFGYIGDCLGRPRALQLTMILSILGALASAFAVPLDGNDPSSIFVFVSITRFFMGVGVGGVYPLAATIAAETSTDSNRGKEVSLVFSMQGVGTLMVPLVGMVFLGIFGTYEDRHSAGTNFVGIGWRFILGVGAVPGLILMPFKATSGNAASETGAPSRSVSLIQVLRNARYWPSIIGCAGGWLLFDITFYGNTLFAPTVLKAVFHQGSGLTPVLGKDLKDNLCLQLALLALLGLPGYYVAVCFMDKFGRKIIQLQGFLMMAVLYGALGLFLDTLKDDAGILLVVYGLTYFFSNFGPNSTTFILPSESFPFEVRSTLNGFCAAAGKLGATIGSACFKPIVNRLGTSDAFYLCSLCALMGLFVTIFFVQDRRGRGMARDESFMEDCTAA